MKLNLKKQTLLSLSDKEMKLTKAGGQKRSNRLGTHCRYSGEHQTTTYHPTTGGGCVETTSCVGKDHYDY